MLRSVAGGGFAGVLLAILILVAQILARPGGCPENEHERDAAAGTLTEFLYEDSRTLLA